MTDFNLLDRNWSKTGKWCGFWRQVKAIRFPQSRKILTNSTRKKLEKNSLKKNNGQRTSSGVSTRRERHAHWMEPDEGSPWEIFFHIFFSSERNCCDVFNTFCGEETIGGDVSKPVCQVRCSLTAPKGLRSVLGCCAKTCQLFQLICFLMAPSNTLSLPTTISFFTTLNRALSHSFILSLFYSDYH